MKYALLVYNDPNQPPPSPEESARYWAIRDEPGVFDGAHLSPPTTATTVRVADGSALVTDGPFAETKEVFGGYYLLDVDDLDAAIAIAAKVPATWTGGSVEIRPVMGEPS